MSLFRHILLLEKRACALDLQQPNVVVDVAVMVTMAIGAPKLSRANYGGRGVMENAAMLGARRV